MATFTKGYTFGATEQVTAAKLHTLIESATISNIGNSDVAVGAGISESKIDFTSSIYVGIATNQTVTGDKTFSGTNSFTGANSFTHTPTFSDKNTASSVVVLDASAKLPAVDGSALTSVVSSANVNLNGNQLGAWASKNINQIYQATTDGFVLAYSAGSSDDMTGLTDSNATPTTQRAIFSVGGTGQGSIMFPVRKNDYWEVVSSGTITVFWLPMGS